MERANAQLELEATRATNWHALEERAVLARLQATPDGLQTDQVEARQQTFGRNELPAAHAPTLVEILLHQFASPLIYILLVAGAISVLIGDRRDAIFIFAVVLLNAGLGGFQEWKAEQSVSALQRLLTITARVRRDDTTQQVPAEELVPGDVVLLESGARVPADMRLLRAASLEIDESLLTGESLAVAKRTTHVVPTAPVSERTNMAFAGSTVTSGRGRGIVVSTGLQTEVGQIARAVTAATAAKPPLVIRMERFARQISIVVVIASLVLAGIELSHGTPFREVFFLAVALAVSSVPEGLPVALTVALSIGTNRMARRNVIVRKLTAVEGLGSCTNIASDKTGTLTVNQQTVRLVVLPVNEQYEVSGEGYTGVGTMATATGEPLTEDALARLETLATAAVHCNEARLTREQDQWTHHGDAVDIALLALAYKLSLDPEDMRRAVSPVGEVPFESERKYAAQAYRDDGHTWVALKGAAEAVLPFCATMRTARGTIAIDAPALEQEALTLAESGYRVLAIAGGSMTAGEMTETWGERDIPPLTFLGLVGLIDPLRPEVAGAVARCRQAGITVAMVTGDHPATALAIARELQIASTREDVITGSQLAELEAVGPTAFEHAVESARVFARVSPLQKLQIVQSLTALGHFVAVTGDGVNDAPAMRAANIGVAMGSGTDVAKDTAAIIVTDDNFASIEAGVEEGRFAYDNIRKVTYLLVSTGAAEIVLFTLAIIFGLPLPLFAVQLLWLNLVTNGIQDVALAFEGGEPGAMRRPPRKPTESIFNSLMIQETAVSGATIGLIAFGMWWWMTQSGMLESEARNLLLLLMVLFENVHVFNCRSEYVSAFKVPLRRNVLLVAGVGAALGLHLLSMHVPFMQSVLRIMPVSLGDFFILVGLSLSVFVVMEVFKLIKGGRRPGTPRT